MRADESFDAATGWLYDGHGGRLQERRRAAGRSSARIPRSSPRQDPDKVSRANRARSKAYRPALDLIAGFDINWTIVSAATPAWAKAVFPDVPEDVAVAQAVGRDLRGLARRYAPTRSPPGTTHNAGAAGAHEAAERARRYAALHFRGPGTDLRVGLADDHEWNGGSSRGEERHRLQRQHPDRGGLHHAAQGSGRRHRHAAPSRSPTRAR